MIKSSYASTRSDDFPMSRGLIWLSCLVLTPLFGSILYYAWRKDNLSAAVYANRVSWASWGLWILLGTIVSKFE